MSFQRVILEGLIGNIYDLKEYGEDGKAIDFSIATQEYDFKAKENKTVALEQKGRDDARIRIQFF